MSKGKNFSTNNTGKRKNSDFYETPYSITYQLFEKEHFNRDYSILEPCCGNNAITRVMNNLGYQVDYYDKFIEHNNRCKDFITEENKYYQMVTNPPFSLAFEFIQKAKIIIENKFAFLLPLSYLHGKKRYDHIYNCKDFPLKKVYVFTRYPLLGNSLREDGKYNTGMMVYAWFIWERQYDADPTIDWIDNNDFVLSKKEE